VTAKQVDLQLGERVVRNANLGEAAEPRIDAVDGLVAARERVDDGALLGHARARLVCKRDWCMLIRDRGKIVERQRVAIEKNHRPIVVFVSFVVE
jgi:hypothetical protein